MSETLLIGYVRRALEAIENGESVDPHALCEEHPELAEAVAEAIGLRSGLGGATAAAQAIDPLVGRVLGGRYRLEAALGRGAMGVVYAAHDTELDRDVAVKLFALGPGHGEHDAERFSREALALARLDHPNVVRIFDRGTAESGEPWIVVERLDGHPLSEILGACEAACDRVPEFGAWSDGLFGERRPGSTWLRAVVAWLADVAAGLQQAHEVGVFHRDVKPSNIFVRDDLSAVLLDFGIAVRTEDAALTATHAALGTPWYMTPEQVAGGHQAAPTLDVYSLSATLYHLLALRPPFEGDAVSVFARIAIDEPTPLRTLRPDLPRDLIAIVEHGMERDPRRRYQTIGALEADLRALLDHRPVAVRPLSTIGRWTRRVRRRPARSTAIFASAVALAAVAIAGPIWIERAETQRVAEYRARVARLPRLLAIEVAPAWRTDLPAAERREWIAELDAILLLEPDDLLRRLLRTALVLDDGDRTRAGLSMRALADAYPSPYLDDLARRYERAAPERAGILAIDLGDLPEPGTDVDLLAASFVGMRARTRGAWQQAVEWLARSRARGAAELRLVALAGLGEPHAEELYRAALSVEDKLGFATASTVASRGVARTHTRDWEQAETLLERADALCPDQPDLLVNLGVVKRRLGAPSEAEAMFRGAIAARPSFWLAYQNLALVHKDRREFTEARRVAESMPIREPGAAWNRANVLGRIALEEAVESEHGPERRSLAAESARHYEHAAELTRGRTRARTLQRATMSRALATGDWAGAVEQMVLLMEDAADEPDQLMNLEALIDGGGLDVVDAKLVRFLLVALPLRLLPRDEERRAKLQRRLEDLREAIEQR